MKNPRLIVLLVVALILGGITAYIALNISSDIAGLNKNVKEKQEELESLKDRVNTTVTLEKTKEDLNAQLDDLIANGYINSENIRADVNKAAEMFNIRITSDSQSSPRTSGKYKYTTISIGVSGLSSDIRSFIDYFENHPTGAYDIQNISINTASVAASMTINLRLAEPNI